MQKIRQLALEHIILYGLMFLSAALVVPIGARAVPLAILALAGPILLSRQPRWAGLVLVSWCLLTFATQFSAYFFDFGTGILVVLPVLAQLVISWVWWRTGRIAPTSLEGTMSWDNVVLGSAAIAAFSFEAWLRFPQDPMNAAFLMLLFMTLLQVILLLAFWRASLRSAMSPGAGGSWLVGWYLSYFLVAVQDEPHGVVRFALLLCFFTGCVLLQRSLYKTLAAAFAARRRRAAWFSAIVAMTGQTLLAVIVFWEMYAFY